LKGEGRSLKSQSASRSSISIHPSSEQKVGTMQILSYSLLAGGSYVFKFLHFLVAWIAQYCSIYFCRRSKFVYAAEPTPSPEPDPPLLKAALPLRGLGSRAGSTAQGVGKGCCHARSAARGWERLIRRSGDGEGAPSN
jgi:hypothetical protein